MNNLDLSNFGIQLAAQLDEIAKTLHPKSEEFNVLLWEADILRAKARNIVHGDEVLPHLRNSVLLPHCRTGLLSTFPALVEQVRRFYLDYDRQSRA